MTDRKPTTPCIEIAICRARGGADADLERALVRSQAWLAAQPGFLSRRLAHDAKEGTWVDTVEWRSAEDARRAMEAYASAPFSQELDGAIDPESFRSLHAEPVALPA